MFAKHFGLKGLWFNSSAFLHTRRVTRRSGSSLENYSTERCGVRFLHSPPSFVLSLAQLVERSIARKGEGSIPSGNTILYPFRLTGRTPPFEGENCDSNSRMGANHPRSSTVEHNPYKIEVFGSNPNADTSFRQISSMAERRYHKPLIKVRFFYLPP